MRIRDVGKKIKSQYQGWTFLSWKVWTSFFVWGLRELSAEIPPERKSNYKATFLKRWNWRQYGITIFLSLKLFYYFFCTMIIMSICFCVNHPLMSWFTPLWIIIVSFRNVFIANLAVSDLCLCLVTMPLTLVEVHHRRHDYRLHLHDYYHQHQDYRHYRHHLHNYWHHCHDYL